MGPGSIGTVRVGIDVYRAIGTEHEPVRHLSTRVNVLSAVDWVTCWIEIVTRRATVAIGGRTGGFHGMCTLQQLRKTQTPPVGEPERLNRHARARNQLAVPLKPAPVPVPSDSHNKFRIPAPTHPHPTRR